MRKSLFTALLLVAAPALNAQAQLFGDIANDPNKKQSGWYLSAQIGASFGLPFTNAKNPSSGTSSSAYRSSVIMRSGITIPLEAAVQYGFSERFRIGAGIKRFSFNLKSDLDLTTANNFDIKSSATIPFLRADILLQSSSKGGVGISLQAGKPSIGGGLSGVSGSSYLGCPFFYQFAIAKKTFLLLDLQIARLAFDHDSPVVVSEKVRTSVLLYGGSIGVMARL